MKKYLLLSLCFVSIGLTNFSFAQKNKKPNLLIIHTDEHNLRTLGCYRKTLSDEQAFMWGKETIVETPNLDKIAEGGVLCENWYATSPVCTPSRASMMTGLYPVATGSPINDMPLNDDVITFGQILKDNGYATSYVGKWHLDGEDKPGFEPARKFGFDHNRYMMNRGHWKILKEEKEGVVVDQVVKKNGNLVFDQEKANEKSFTTDFLVDRALKILEQDKDKPFCLMLSIPDPHGPNHVRAPYNTMYDHLTFEEPRTAYKEGDESPLWVSRKKKNSVKAINQNAMRQYYGMVKCVDDNVGRILSFLKENNLEENTIVVFTSDHGDLLGEHGKQNKGLPYETSARVAFMLRYPKKVKSGKQINKAFTMADFTPTILGLMDVDHSEYKFHGIDASVDFKSKKKRIEEDRIVYITNARSKWVAAVDNRYKLVVSPNDKPWLFDLQEDPDELINFYTDPAYQKIAQRLHKELFVQMEKYNEPALKKHNLLN
ncbi:sulfatase family protein [Flammeovirga kamogawensis]|uniref:Sulfatase n=1 Tax=Flammeovirga kamogawensis TaxID=373891 RepID=A0ABX8H2E0_9BACT|nr:sulfatase [Flammeovirga kamogawensis]MBB6462289.1 putative sulfatase [Flammeovirga kamogawensis]QWG09320.1 sulfatase [Flammeovirga kamogawensis]TRX64842.1 sulfatase [Flammeovirga kamogawensis]